MCQPTYAADGHLIEPWWRVLRALALKGRRFERWDEVQTAVAAATADGNRHCHAFVWGSRRKRRHAARRAGRAHVPLVERICWVN